jgi:hypothetical protein
MGVTFIPIIWTQSTAVPVALERNSARVSSAIARRLTKVKFKMQLSQRENSLLITLTQRKCNNLPSWVVSIPLGLLRCWVLLLLVLTTHDHRLTAIVCGRCRSLCRIHQIKAYCNMYMNKNLMISYKSYLRENRQNLGNDLCQERPLKQVTNSP